MWFLGQNWSQNCQNVFKKDVFLGDFGIFYEMRKKIKEKSFSHILDNIVIVQVKKNHFRDMGKIWGQNRH